MRVAGVDFSSHAIDVVKVPLDAGQPEWFRFELTGADAFDRTRSVADAMPGRSSVFWDDVLAVGIEHPAGKFGTGPLMRIQGAVLACIPARMLVHPMPPSTWRVRSGLPGHATKHDVRNRSVGLLHSGYPNRLIPLELIGKWNEWPQDAHDAHLIAVATRTLIIQEKAA